MTCFSPQAVTGFLTCFTSAPRIPELRKLPETTGPSHCDEYGSEDCPYTFSTPPVVIDITSGTVLGPAGRKFSVPLDLEPCDLASAPLAFANPRR